jgi:hypothetical protein
MGDTSDLDQQIEQLRKCEVIKASEVFFVNLKKVLFGNISILKLLLTLQESDVKILCAKAREILGMLRLGKVPLLLFFRWTRQLSMG